MRVKTAALWPMLAISLSASAIGLAAAAPTTALAAADGSLTQIISNTQAAVDSNRTYQAFGVTFKVPLGWHCAEDFSTSFGRTFLISKGPTASTRTSTGALTQPVEVSLRAN